MSDYGLKTQTPGMVGGRTARIMEQGLYNSPARPGDGGRLRARLAGASPLHAGRCSAVRHIENAGRGRRGAPERRFEFIDRGKAVAAKAYNAIPISDQASIDEQRRRHAPAANWALSVESRTSRCDERPEAHHLSERASERQVEWADLKQFRSIIGEKIGDMRFGEGHSTSDLRALYGALSEDMQHTAAANGPKAVSAFNRANNLYRQQQQLIEGSLTRILGKDGQMTPERAAAAVQAMTAGGKATGDLRTLAQIKSATIKSGAWDEIASTLIHLGGQPAKSEGREFNPETFVNWYSDMSRTGAAASVQAGIAASPSTGS
jgi:hypothetical protein